VAPRMEGPLSRKNKIPRKGCRISVVSVMVPVGLSAVRSRADQLPAGMRRPEPLQHRE